MALQVSTALFATPLLLYPVTAGDVTQHLFAERLAVPLRPLLLATTKTSTEIPALPRTTSLISNTAAVVYVPMQVLTIRVAGTVSSLISAVL